MKKFLAFSLSIAMTQTVFANIPQTEENTAVTELLIR